VFSLYACVALHEAGGACLKGTRYAHPHAVLQMTVASGKNSLQLKRFWCIVSSLPVGPQVWNTEGVILIPDHYIFTDDPRANRNVDLLRGYAEKYNIKHFYDIKDRSDFQANPDYKGVCHIALAQEGHAIPGEVLFGTDSHTCNAGAFGMFATGVGNTDAGFILGTGKLLIKVPATIKFNIVGEMPSFLLAKDLILQIIGEIGVRLKLPCRAGRATVR
jgi:homoaconitase/3-isopropylmalate dehydratase large subunit